MSYALDAWAVLELLEGNDPTASRVSEVLEQHPVMSWISLGEVFYVVKRDQGEEEALETLRDLRPRLDLDLPSEDRVLEAARIKAEHPMMSYADAFAAATAAAHGASLLTGDPELQVHGSPWRWKIREADPRIIDAAGDTQHRPCET